MVVSLTTDLHDALLDGAPYRIAIPPGWNGILLGDLDFVGSSGAPPSLAHEWLLGRGYAVAGTARVMNTVSASDWAHRPLQVLHIVKKACGCPSRELNDFLGHSPGAGWRDRLRPCWNSMGVIRCPGLPLRPGALIRFGG